MNQEPERVSIFFQGKRVDVDQDSKGNWYSEINGINSNRKISLQIRNSQNSISVNLANLFKVLFELNDQGDFKTIFPVEESPDGSKILNFFSPDKPAWEGTFS